MNATAQWHRGRGDVIRKVTRNQGKTSTRITGRGELSTLIGDRGFHADAGRVPVGVLDHALDSIRETAHGADGDELARLADRWCHALGEDLPALIGNERNSWSEAGTAPTDPAVMASIAATSCGITGGANPHVDALAGTFVTRKHHARTFPTRLRIGAFSRRKDEQPRRVTVGRRTIRPDVWQDPVTETTRPRLKWTIVELPALRVDGSIIFGHGKARARTATVREQRTENARAIRDAVTIDGAVIDAVGAAFELALNAADQTGRWAWSTREGARGVITFSASGRIGVTGEGVRVSSARTVSAAMTQVMRQTAPA